MRKLLILLVMIPMLILPAGALELTAPEVPDSGAQHMPQDTGDFASGIWELLGNVLGAVRPDLKEASKICLGLMGTVLLISLLQGVSERTKQTANLAGTAAIAASLLLSANSMITLGADTVTEICEYGKLLLPVLTAAMAAQGAGTASAALYAGTAAFTTLLSNLIGKLLVPMAYLHLGLAAANSATGESVLKRLKDLLKWAMCWCLKSVLTLFTAYMGITGAVTGATDAAVLKAAKTAISTAVPVVGGVLSNAAESVLAGAALMKNAAGIYGILAMLAIFLEPFLRIGIQFGMLKVTAAVTSVFGCKEMTDLIGDFSEAMGFLLAMTGSVCVLELISIVCFLKGVG